MDAPFVTASEQLRNDLAAQTEPVKVEVPQPNTGFAALDNPQSGSVEANKPVENVAPQVNTDYERRMQKVLSQAQKAQQELNAAKAERERLKADMDELAQYRELKARAKDDPVAIAETFGYKPDEYATMLVEKGSLTPERRKILEQQRELNELKQWRQTQEQAQQKAREQSYYTEVQSQLAKYGQDQPETYDLVHRTKSYDKVLSKIQEKYNQSLALGEDAVDPWQFADEAFQSVETELENYYLPVLESPKLKAKLTSIPAEQASPTAALSQLAARKTPGTITSKLRAQSAPPKELTEAERLQKAGEVLLNQIYGRRG